MIDTRPIRNFIRGVLAASLVSACWFIVLGTFWSWTGWGLGDACSTHQLCLTFRDAVFPVWWSVIAGLTVLGFSVRYINSPSILPNLFFGLVTGTVFAMILGYIFNTFHQDNPGPAWIGMLLGPFVSLTVGAVYELEHPVRKSLMSPIVGAIVAVKLALVTTVTIISIVLGFIKDILTLPFTIPMSLLKDAQDTVVKAVNNARGWADDHPILSFILIGYLANQVDAVRDWTEEHPILSLILAFYIWKWFKNEDAPDWAQAWDD